MPLVVVALARSRRVRSAASNSTRRTKPQRPPQGLGQQRTRPNGHNPQAAASPEAAECACSWPCRRSRLVLPAPWAVLEPTKAVLGKAPPPVADNARLDTRFFQRGWTPTSSAIERVLRPSATLCAPCSHRRCRRRPPASLLSRTSVALGTSSRSLKIITRSLKS